MLEKVINRKPLSDVEAEEKGFISQDTNDQPQSVNRKNKQFNSYKKVEVPAEKIQQTLFDKILGAPVNVSGYNIQDIEKYAQKEPGEFVFSGARASARSSSGRERSS